MWIYALSQAVKNKTILEVELFSILLMVFQLQLKRCVRGLGLIRIL